MENASGRKPLYKNGKPYAVSVFQRNEDAQIGGLFPMTKKAKCISSDFVDHRLRNLFRIKDWRQFLSAIPRKKG